MNQSALDQFIDTVVKYFVAPQFAPVVEIVAEDVVETIVEYEQIGGEPHTWYEWISKIINRFWEKLEMHMEHGRM